MDEGIRVRCKYERSNNEQGNEGRKRVSNFLNELKEEQLEESGISERVTEGMIGQCYDAVYNRRRLKMSS